GNSAYSWNPLCTSRLWGGVCAMSSPSSRIWPSVGRSNPAIIRSDVVFPHPEGPSSEKNSPEGIWRLMPSTAVNSPKRFTRSTSWTSPPAMVGESIATGQLNAGVGVQSCADHGDAAVPAPSLLSDLGGGGAPDPRIARRLLVVRAVLGDMGDRGGRAQPPPRSVVRTQRGAPRTAVDRRGPGDDLRSSAPDALPHQRSRRGILDDARRGGLGDGGAADGHALDRLRPRRSGQ